MQINWSFDADAELAWFTLWSSVVHGLIMAVQSVSSPGNLGHLYGDVLALFLVAALLGWLCPAAARFDFLKAAA